MNRHQNLWDQYVTIGSQGDELINTINALSRKQPGRLTIVLPSDDESVQTVSEFRERLDSSVCCLLPDKLAVRRLLNKGDFHEFAKSQGFDVPAQRVVRSIRELTELAETMRLPLLLKPEYRDARWNEVFPVDKVIVVSDLDQSIGIAEKALDLAGELIAQELVPGDDNNVYFVLAVSDDQGEILGFVAGQKVLQWPHRYGSTAVAISGAPSEVVDIGLRFLSLAGLVGLGSIEMKYDERDGSYYLIEPTIGRNDHQSYLATAAGCNLTLAAVRCMFGTSVRVSPQRRSMWVDSVAVFRLLRAGGFQPIFSILKAWRFRRVSLATGGRNAWHEVAAIVWSFARRRGG